ncbi:hypothetical protein B7463_g9676, partial [Scytalidium lignicola]
MPPAEQEGRILLAINAIKTKQITSVRKAARVFDVPRGTLNARLHGRVQMGTTYTKRFRMTKLEEESLVQWVLSMRKRGMPPRPSGVQAMANTLVSERGEATPPPPVGKNWLTAFLHRHPELKTKYIRKYNYKRAKCEDPKVIREWFNRFLEVKGQYGILDEDIYNFDETGFAMGTIATTKVVTSSDTFGKPPLIQPGNREWVTVVESSPNGWTNDRIGLEWLQNTFNPFTKDKTKGQYRMLILDGHGSHVAPEFDRYCTQNNIIPLCMPPHSSHILQPLDVTCFAVLKRNYGAAIEAKVRGKIQHIDKGDFLNAYQSIRQQTFKSETIRNGFIATGLIPYNPEHVMAKLTLQIEDKTPTPPGSAHSNHATQWVPETPHNSIQLQLQSQTIQRLVREQYSPTTPTKTAFNQLVKGCELAMHHAVFLAKEVEELRAANASIQQKLGRSRKLLVHTGSLTAQEAQKIVESRAIAQEVVEVANPEVMTQTLPTPQRRPPKCSGCGSTEHKINKCPDLASN